MYTNDSNVSGGLSPKDAKERRRALPGSPGKSYDTEYMNFSRGEK